MVFADFGKFGRLVVLASLGLLTVEAPAQTSDPTPVWTACGWGGGGYYWSAAFDPVNDGVLYMGGDVAGVYKSVDHGKSWRMVNDGIASYGVFSLAVAPQKPKTVYAATEMGLCKSDDGAEHWRLLPKTGPSELRITGEKMRSIRSVAVDPTNGEVVYAGTPAGKVFKSVDGGQSWKAVYEPGGSDGASHLLQAQFGKASNEWSGGLWLPVQYPPQSVCTAFGVTLQGDGTVPREAYLTLRSSDGVPYRSRNLNGVFKGTAVQELRLTASEFEVDPGYKAEHPGAPALDWKKIVRMDLSFVGPLAEHPFSMAIGNPVFVASARNGKPQGLSAASLTESTTVQTYGNVKTGPRVGGPVYSVAVSKRQPSLVLAATKEGLMISQSAGASWKLAKAPKKASSAVVAATNPNLIYASFFGDGVWKTTDRGQTWARASEGIAPGVEILEVVVSPNDPNEVYAIGSVGWNGHMYRSTDGAETWTESSVLTPDRIGDPTLPRDAAASNLSAPSNITLNPKNPHELFVSANWRPVHSGDGGKTWTERVNKADISVITDIRFRDRKAYVTAMDEGVLSTEDGGATWRQLWPLAYDVMVGGHSWRLGFSGNRIVTTSSPWEKAFSQVVLSDDDGKSFRVATAGLPAYVPKANVMWDRGYPRALAIDRKDPKLMYLGLDGDPAEGNEGGGIFRSTDAGETWSRLANQPGSRRMFYGLAIDLTDSNRLYWGACGTGGGLYMSPDAGATWKLVFSGDSWVFNAQVADDGTVYALGKNLWRSRDHGSTWTQVTHFVDDRTLVGFEIDPRDPKTYWISATTWNASTDGAILKTTDDGATWKDITGNIGMRKPVVLRFDPATNELWAGGSGLFRIKQ